MANQGRPLQHHLGAELRKAEFQVAQDDTTRIPPGTMKWRTMSGQPVIAPGVAQMNLVVDTEFGPIFIEVESNLSDYSQADAEPSGRKDTYAVRSLARSCRGSRLYR